MPYGLRVATPEIALWTFQGWPPVGQVACGRLTTPLETPRHMSLLSCHPRGDENLCIDKHRLSVRVSSRPCSLCYDCVSDKIRIIGVRSGVSMGEEYGCRQASGQATPETAKRSFQGWPTCRAYKGHSDTLGSPWPPLSIRPCWKCQWPTNFS
jgi:hypothetical protein